MSWRTEPGPWERLTDTGMLDRVADPEPPDRTGRGRWRDRSTDTGQWDRTTDTGQWDRFTDTTEWRHDELAGLARDGDAGRTGPAPDVPRTGPDSTDSFWSGTRLAGDDPRWMGIPDSAPHSPAVAYPSPGGPGTPVRRSGEPGSSPTRRRAAAASTAGRAGSVGSVRSVSGAGKATGRRSPGSRGGTGSAGRGRSALAVRARPSPLSRRLEDDLLDPRPSGPLTAILYTAAWYAVAVLAVFVWVLTLDASVPVGCVPNVSGSCESERGQAISALLDAMPRFAAALATGLVVAALMRWFNRTWRAVTVGLAAAVVGGGLSTVLFSIVSGRPLG